MKSFKPHFNYLKIVSLSKQRYFQRVVQLHPHYITVNDHCLSLESQFVSVVVFDLGIRSGQSHKLPLQAASPRQLVNVLWRGLGAIVRLE